MIEELVGKTLIKIDGGLQDDQMRFHCATGEVYLMHHEQDCCESVVLSDIAGDLDDLIGRPILIAEERTSPYLTLVDAVADRLGGVERDEDVSVTWTFYEIGTFKGRVTIRWHGSSNGYYSEGVTFERLKERNDDE